MSGIGYVVDEAAREAGTIRLEVEVPARHSGAENLQLKVTFPDLYPHFRPEVSAPTLEMGHHQHPFGRNLCLIGRSSRWWMPSDTLAWLLTEQLKAALSAGKEKPEDPNVEEDQGEPFSVYYNYTPNGMILLDSEWSIPSTERNGAAQFHLPMVIPQPDRQWLGAMTQLLTSGGELIAKVAPDTWPFPGTEAKGRWSRIDEPVRVDDPEAIWTAVSAADPLQPPVLWLPDGIGMQVRAVAFPEEHGRRVLGEGWLFLVKPVLASRAGRRQAGQRGRAPSGTKPFLVRAGRVGRLDLSARVPELVGLAEKRVVLVGCGALGSVVADHLARAGVGGFVLLDKDGLEPGNLARHAAGIQHSGLHKSSALAGLIRERNPYAEVEPHHLAIGGTQKPGETSQQTRLADHLKNAHLVIDASAEVAVQEVVSQAARDAGVSCVVVEATNGAWGGSVVQFPPNHDACFLCFQWNRVEEIIPVPNAAPFPLIQPPGCAEPTFTGAGFDLAEVALQAARTVTALLLAGERDAYPSDGTEVATLAHRDPAGNRSLPLWSAHKNPRNPSCGNH